MPSKDNSKKNTRKSTKSTRSTKSTTSKSKSVNNSDIVADVDKAVKQFKRLSPFGKVLVVILVLAIIAGGIWYYFTKVKEPEDPTPNPVAVEGEVNMYFLELGTKNTGDCIYIQCGNIDIIVDSGGKSSREANNNTIYNFINPRVTDGIIEYVIVTHADADHIGGFAGTSNVPSLFTRFDCRTIIDFPRSQHMNEDGTTKSSATATYKDYVTARDAEVEAGAVHYTALQCYNNDGDARREYTLGDGIKMEFLYNYYYEHATSNENDYSVCFRIIQGDKVFLFVGDLEGAGEQKLIDYEANNIGKVDLYKVAHHGSYTGSIANFMARIQPDIAVICCDMGYEEYTHVIANVFPAQATIDNIAPYTDKVYVTTQYNNDSGTFSSANGDILVKSNASGITVTCSASDTLLKDNAWFIANRTMPSAWQDAA